MYYLIIIITTTVIYFGVMCLFNRYKSTNQINVKFVEKFKSDGTLIYESNLPQSISFLGEDGFSSTLNELYLEIEKVKCCKVLSILHCNIDSFVLDKLSRIEGLESLSFSNNHFYIDINFNNSILFKNKSLKSLSLLQPSIIFGERFSFEYLPPNLEELVLQDSLENVNSVYDFSLGDAVSKLFSLKYLNVNSLHYGEEFFQSIHTLKKLESLNIFKTRISGRKIIHILENNPNLHTLFLDHVDDDLANYISNTQHQFKNFYVMFESKEVKKIFLEKYPKLSSYFNSPYFK